MTQGSVFQYVVQTGNIIIKVIVNICFSKRNRFSLGDTAVRSLTLSSGDESNALSEL